jgi:hypothetical protein
MTTPPELDELVERLLARPVIKPTPTCDLVDRSRRRRRRHRNRASALGVLAAIAAVAAVVAIDRPSRGSDVRVATRPPTTTAAAPQGLTVTCVGNAVHLSATVVQAQPDGVHLTLKFTEKHGDFSYRSLNQSLAFRDEGSGTFSPGPPHFAFPWVVAVPPGKAVVACAQLHFVTPSIRRTIEVVDPNSYWSTITDPPCSRVKVDTTANGSNAVAAVQNWLATKGQAHDQITVLGYPRSVPPTIGITNKARLVAVVSLLKMSGPKPQPWLVNGQACANF